MFVLKQYQNSLIVVKRIPDVFNKEVKILTDIDNDLHLTEKVSRPFKRVCYI